MRLALRGRTLLGVFGNCKFDARDAQAWARAVEDGVLRRDAASGQALLQAADRALVEL